MTTDLFTERMYALHVKRNRRRVRAALFAFGTPLLAIEVGLFVQLDCAACDERAAQAAESQVIEIARKTEQLWLERALDTIELDLERKQVRSVENRIGRTVPCGLADLLYDEWVPPIEATVSSVGSRVRLAKGAEDGVKPGYTFTVLRGLTFVGKVMVTRVEIGASEAIVCFTQSDLPIRPGDMAATRLR